MRSPLAVCLAVLVTACGSNEASAPADAARTDASADASVADAPASDAPSVDATPAQPDVPEAVAALVRARPYTSRVPSTWDGRTALPLVVLLHGYGASGALQAAYLGLTALAESRGFLLAYPDGTLDAAGRRFWNASAACCDFARNGVDDVAYVSAVIDDMAARYRVDPRRIFLVGHSNGGFMSHRMACDRSTRIAAIASLAGAQTNDPSTCAPTAPVAVLQIHGTMDDTVRYDGGMLTTAAITRYPSARDTVAQWATLNRCGAFVATTMRHDYVSDVAGDETVIGRHEGCMGGAADLWTMEGAGHIPAVTSAWGEAVYDWLMAHPKPAS